MKINETDLQPTTTHNQNSTIKFDDAMRTNIGGNDAVVLPLLVRLVHADHVSNLANIRANVRVYIRHICQTIGAT